jgi:hypothetical protein
VKSRALVLNAMAENLDALKWWWLGVFIAPTTKMAVGEAVSRWAHRTVRCATGHCPRTVHVHCSLLQTTVGAVAVALHGTPDSPVNYSGVAFPETRRWRVRVDSPWCTGHSPVRQTRAAFSFFCSFLLNPILDLLLVCVDPLAPVELII